MIELPFASFQDRYAGQEGWVVGRGPTRFSYEELARVEGPVFFINDAVGQEKWLPEGHPAFFFAHDAAMAGWLFQKNLRSVPVLIADQPETGPAELRRPGLISGAQDPRLAGLARAVLYRKEGPFDRASLLSRTREEIARSGQLWVAGGTLHPLLHFAWYVGCAKLSLVGCDGLPGLGYDSRLENLSASRQEGALTIRLQQEKILRQLAIPGEYHGTPPHRVEMTMEIQAGPADPAALRAWAETLQDRLRAAGCGELAAHDFLERSHAYWIKGCWPSMEACAAFLGSDCYQAVGPGALEALTGGNRAGLKVACRAVL